ncbi:MAG: mechanosensitive ion channel family protein [Gemmatimonadales bacterium]|nr:mechanosensitive ion channel family protein [Gemmatimonadales bacterium]
MIRSLSSLLFDLTASVERFIALFGIELEELRVVGVKILVLWVSAFVAWALVRIVSDRIVAAADDGDDDRLTYHEKRAQTIAQLLRGVGKIVILIFTLVLTLNQFVDITPLLGGAGILALAISFGSQSLVKDVISGFFVLMENQFAVGDVIEVAGKTGTVEKMSLRVVMLRDMEGTLHIVPNGQITTVSNRTRGWSRAVVDIGVAYDADVDAVLAILRDEAERFGGDEGWQTRLDGMPDVVGVQSLGDNAVTIRVLLRTQPGNQWEAGREFRRRAKIRLDREGIEIPFPQRTVHVRHHGAVPDNPADRAAITDAAAGGA